MSSVYFHTQKPAWKIHTGFLITGLVCAERKQCDGSCSLDGEIDLALVFSAGARNTAGQNLASFRNEMTQRLYVLVIQGIDLVNARLADLSSRSSHSISLNHLYPP